MLASLHGLKRTEIHNLNPMNESIITLEPVAVHNWRAVAKLEVGLEQREFVAGLNFYLALRLRSTAVESTRDLARGCGHRLHDVGD
jgi:hypothetical protein